MESNIKLEAKKIIESLSHLEKMYDGIRVVDPVQNQVAECNFIYDKNTSSICYEFWIKESRCENCVSIRAVKDLDSFVKIENQNDKVYMIMASPVFLSDKTYAIELIKDVTNSGLILNINGKSVAEINNIINEMNEEIIKDGLTNIYNRRYIEERLPLDILNKFNENQQVSVILADIDHFKNINDSYGHLAGDYVLKEFANIVKYNIRRNTDWIARYGGEEFLIVLVGADENIAFEVAEKIRQAVEESNIQYNEQDIRITASFGVYTLNSNKITCEEVLSYADKNLYLAKNNGRNKTVSLNYPLKYKDKCLG